MTHTNYDKYKGHTEEYYLQRKHSGFIGNSPVWWAKEGKGYTAYLQNAERFSKETAEFYVNEDPDKWAMFKCFEIDRRLHAIFDMQDFGRLEKEPEKPNPWGGDYIEPNPLLILQRCMELEEEKQIFIKMLILVNERYADHITNKEITAEDFVDDLNSIDWLGKSLQLVRQSYIDIPQPNDENIIQQLYNSEINASIGWFWDGGFDVSIGDELNGILAEHTTSTWDEAKEWLKKAVIEYYPDSTFTKQQALSRAEEGE